MEKLKSAGGVAGGMLLLLVILVIPILLLFGAAELSLWMLDFIPRIIGIAVFSGIIIIPLAVIPASRGLASSLYGLASIAFGACVWFFALAITYTEWGMLGVIVGIVMFGAGVVLTGIVAAVFAGQWVVLGNLAILLGLYVVSSILRAWLARLAEDRVFEIEQRLQNESFRVRPTRIPSSEIRDE
ncbi:hypothetical protein [Alteraurantiacibacter palmitatis]|uniref:Uncharacterized protein n=1 Tax=Alteraurantiacibacter palmitatis TaxID=2054628 RepID=A0ABV7E553_9SPHN